METGSPDDGADGADGADDDELLMTPVVLLFPDGVLVYRKPACFKSIASLTLQKMGARRCDGLTARVRGGRPRREQCLRAGAAEASGRYGERPLRERHFVEPAGPDGRR